MSIIAALYQFKAVEHPRKLQAKLLKWCQNNKLMGTLLIGSEGINGTVSGTSETIPRLRTLLIEEGFENLEWKTSCAEESAFLRMKVKLKNEIVTIGDRSVDPLKKVGEYVEPSDWNDLISDPDVWVLDVRNDYEIDVGTFKGAINPKTETFREFPNFVCQETTHRKPKKVAMFCTGGIRCEKASSWMLDQGFEEVFHLKGGILNYIEQIPEESSLWQGECFVFDERVTVDHALKPGTYKQCFGCRRPLSPEDVRSELYTEGVSCRHCIGTKTFEQIDRYTERQKQMKLANEKGVQHIGSSD